MTRFSVIDRIDRLLSYTWGASMQSESLEELHERFMRLVLQRDSFLSEEERRHIADKFAKKSLNELNEIAKNLQPLEV